MNKPFSELTEVHFRGLYGTFPSFLSPYSRRFGKVLLYLGSYRCCLGPKVFIDATAYRTFLCFRVFRPRLFYFLASYRIWFSQKALLREQHPGPHNFESSRTEWLIFPQSNISTPNFLSRLRGSQNFEKSACVFWWTFDKTSYIRLFNLIRI